jgi:hypothetical protein
LSVAEAMKSAGVTVPPPEFPLGVVASVTVNVVAVGTLATVHVPLYAAMPTPRTITRSPAASACAAVVVNVAVVPTRVAPPGDAAIVESRLPGLITQLTGILFWSSR